MALNVSFLCSRAFINVCFKPLRAILTSISVGIAHIQVRSIINSCLCGVPLCEAEILLFPAAFVFVQHTLSSHPFTMCLCKLLS